MDTGDEISYNKFRHIISLSISRFPFDMFFKGEVFALDLNIKILYFALDLR